MPWEKQSPEDIATSLLKFIGEDPTRQGLEKTPDRFMKAWKQWTAGYEQQVEDVLTVFDDGAENYDEMVTLKDIPIYSHCEHHLAPFFGKAVVSYIPNGRILGLSKIVRIVNIFAQRLQVQERLTSQIADALSSHLQARGVAVHLECRHLCMESRGVQRSGAVTITSAMRGMFRTNPATRAEFLALLK
ncbi:GTP cyclohydrolase I FolE [Candidatus Microgenomates bacterium]|nr:MAG: GTP cyclohydrolase I FolE [Candidatus Microgenomates bacterium]